jgi:hypothetical protein
MLECKQRTTKQNVQVSHKIGNSLCSHPALFISALGGIVVELDQKNSSESSLKETSKLEADKRTPAAGPAWTLVER